MPQQEEPTQSEPQPDEGTPAGDSFVTGRQETDDVSQRPTLADNGTLPSATETYAPTGHHSSLTPGDSVKPSEGYQVIRLHARGGIGQVLLAIDSGLSREVALKEIQPALAHDDASRRRFLLEAEITGRLEHPGVVPVYAIGQSSDDRPFYVMRFIRGESLKEAIEQFFTVNDRKSMPEAFRSLGFRQLLSRFVNVCNTISYAHSRGILHRDLKPSNVMLGPYGETLVVDWGLAKVVGRQDPETVGEATLRPQFASGSSETQAGIAMGTPAYMSPEQAEGKLDSIGTASDIYSLGATLYTILTGRPPFTEPSLDRLLARVREGNCPPPRTLEPGVPRALEAICLKAMALSPADRFATAGLLAQEIEHWLADEPVECCREPIVNRLSRWGRRHKTGVAASGIFLAMATLMLGAGTIVLSQANARIHEERRMADVQRSIAQRQRDLARENFDKAREAVNSYLTLVNDEPHLNKPGLESVRQKLLRSALPYYEEFIEQRGDDPTLRLELAEAYRLTGDITGQIGSRAQARERLERAVQLYDQILSNDAEASKTPVGLARALVSMAYFEVFDDDHKKAETSTDRAIDLLEKLAARPDAVAEFGRLLGRAYDLKSINRSLTNDLSSALAISDKAVDRLESTVRAFPDDLPTKRILARSLNNRAATLLLIGDFDESLVAFERSAVMLRNLLVAEPDEAVATVSLARVMTNIARVHLSLGRFMRATEPIDEALVQVRKLLASSPDMNEYAALYVDVIERRALALAELGRTAQARELIRECLSREKAMTDKGVLNDDLRETFADAWWTSALIDARQGRFTEAGPAFAKSETYFAELVAQNDDQTYYSQRSAVLEDAIRFRPLPAETEAIESRLEKLKAIVAERESRLASGSDPDSRRTELARGLVSLSETQMARDAGKFDPAPLDRALDLIAQVDANRPGSLETRRIQEKANVLQARHLAAKSRTEAARSAIDRAIRIAGNAAAEDPAYFYDLAATHAAASTISAESDAAWTETHRSAAIAAIRKAVETGFDDFPRLRFDPDFAALREVPAFFELTK